MTEERTIRIPGISCGHCVNAIVQELSELDGVQSVNGSPEEKTITVSFAAPLTIERIKAALSDMNYPAE